MAKKRWRGLSAADSLGSGLWTYFIVQSKQLDKISSISLIVEVINTPAGAIAAQISQELPDIKSQIGYPATFDNI